MDLFQHNAVCAHTALPGLYTYVKLILESDKQINKNMNPSCSLQTCRIYLLYGEYMPQFYFRASALFRFLMKFLPTIGCIGQERPVITVTTSLKPLAVGHSYFLLKVLPLDNSGALQNDHIKFLISTPGAINEPLRLSHIFNQQCHWTTVHPWLSSFCFLPPWLSGGCLHPPENIHGSLSSLLLLLSSPLAFYY